MTSLKDLLAEAAWERNLPDCEFSLNRSSPSTRVITRNSV